MRGINQKEIEDASISIKTFVRQAGKICTVTHRQKNKV